MSRAASSVLVFGIYLMVLGPVVIAAPNAVLALVGLPATSEVWIRVVGLLAAILGFYYLQAARHGLVPFYRATVPARVTAFLGFLAFVLLGLVKPSLILFGAVDLSGAAWTYLALKSSTAPA